MATGITYLRHWLKVSRLFKTIGVLSGVEPSSHTRFFLSLRPQKLHGTGKPDCGILA